MPKVILKGHIIVPNSDLAAVQEELSNHIELTLEEEGCLVFEVSQDEKRPNKYKVYEEFADRSSFDLHQQRVLRSRWGEITENAERDYEISDAT